MPWSLRRSDEELCDPGRSTGQTRARWLVARGELGDVPDLRLVLRVGRGGRVVAPAASGRGACGRVEAVEAPERTGRLLHHHLSGLRVGALLRDHPRRREG